MEDSPIIQRLKEFIASTGLTSTQFADKASIPRPTLSQLLHGRNKSINNQILAKLDESFPELDVVWLLFGRKSGQVSSNIKISEPQIEDFLDGGQSESPNPESVTAPQNSISNIHQELKSTAIQENVSPKTIFPASQINEAILKNITDDSGCRKITSIIVLYSDNSFETFNPAT